MIAFRVEKNWGHVKTDTVNWWITLSPYFIPLYALIWIGIWFSVSFYYPLTPINWLLYLGIGLSWGFHLTFTISMIMEGQSDIKSQGFLFSMVIILLFNFLLIELFLVSVLPHCSFLLWWHLLNLKISQSYLWSQQTLHFLSIWLWRTLVSLWQTLFSK